MSRMPPASKAGGFSRLFIGASGRGCAFAGKPESSRTEKRRRIPAAEEPCRGSRSHKKQEKDHAGKSQNPGHQAGQKRHGDVDSQKASQQIYDRQSKKSCQRVQKKLENQLQRGAEDHENKKDDDGDKENGERCV